MNSEARKRCLAKVECNKQELEPRMIVAAIDNIRQSGTVSLRTPRRSQPFIYSPLSPRVYTYSILPQSNKSCLVAFVWINKDPCEALSRRSFDLGPR